MGRTLLIVSILIAFVVVFFVKNDRNVTTTPIEQRASVLEGVSTISEGFDATGTLVFYPNNVGPVPYLFYQNANKSTVAKALVFPNVAPADFFSWSGAHVSVTGKLQHEHVVVSRLVYLSGP